ncbi:MAG: phosphate ABC transporter substrate-binding protein, PhoT family [Bacteroidetes bacterium]|nr:MAG: phosphate ABC transporter substrate-binding protein, PhoT family [Bacteroidota bacterium]
MNKVPVIQNFIIIACRNKIITTCNLVNRHTSYNLFSKMRYTLIMIMLILASCTGGSKSGLNETPTRGNIKITADESFQPLIDAEVFTFIHLYTNAKIKPQYKPEYDVINDFMNDSVPVIVTSKKLTDYQIQYLRDTQIIARTSTYAYDALAIVTSKENKDTLIKYNTIKDIFLGKVRNWKEINPKSKLSNIRVIFDNKKSGTIRYFKELFDIKDSLRGNFFAVNNNAEVINFVSRNRDALGIVSVNWISDKDDSLSMSFIKKINVVAVSQQFINDGSYYRPYQGSIYDKSYPFVREIYLISRETFTGLGSGFINWACAEQGQRIVLKSGLVPATMPIRLVQIKH